MLDPIPSTQPLRSYGGLPSQRIATSLSMGSNNPQIPTRYYATFAFAHDLQWANRWQKLVLGAWLTLVYAHIGA
jgi:hypothetical protein